MKRKIIDELHCDVAKLKKLNRESEKDKRKKRRVNCWNRGNAMQWMLKENGKDKRKVKGLIREKWERWVIKECFNL